MSVRYVYRVIATVEFFVHGDTVEDATENAERMIGDFVLDQGSYIINTCDYSAIESDKENA